MGRFQTSCKVILIFIKKNQPGKEINEELNMQANI